MKIILINLLVLGSFSYINAQVPGNEVQCGSLFPQTDISQPTITLILNKLNDQKMHNTDQIKKDRLFLLNPGFEDSRLEPVNQKYYCPFNAMLEGVLGYYPELREKLEITYIDFPRPRKQIVEILGEENQGLPLLIIERRNLDLSSLKVREYEGVLFLAGSDEIVKYFAMAFSIPLPHP